MKTFITIISLILYLNVNAQIIKTDKQSNVAGISFVALGGGVAMGVANHLTERSTTNYGLSYAMIAGGLVGFKISIFDMSKTKQLKKLKKLQSKENARLSIYGEVCSTRWSNSDNVLYVKYEK